MKESHEQDFSLEPFTPKAAIETVLSNQILIRADVRIGKLPFGLWYKGGQKDSELCVEWKNNNGSTLDMQALSDSFSDTPMEFSVPTALLDFGLLLRRVALAYGFRTDAFEFTIEVDCYGKLVISTCTSEMGRVLRFVLELNAKFMLSNLPVLGDGIGKKDSIGLKAFSVTVTPGKNKVELGAVIELVLMNQPITIQLPPGRQGRLDFAAEAGATSVKWLDVNKDAGPLHLSRLGFEMADGGVTLYVDAGIRLSVLLLEFLGLHLSIPLKAGESIDYGLEGLAVTISSPPLNISGGLYISKEDDIQVYTGELRVQFKSFQVSAMGSYGQFQGGGASLFVYLMLGYPFGGPPIFFVTGLAGGFGYNRAITLPAKVQDVGQFPFVAAAMGKGDLKSDMPPAQVLVKMNQYIKPRKGQYFASVGIRFTSFGVVESFVLANIQFGERLELSLLGLSKLSMPPRSTSPMAYAELALKAVIAPEEGVVSVEGALTSESYLLSEDCKLRGGFAFYLWFGDNPHAGDFVITLGGYRNGFHVPHYPSVDRLGVNWKITRDLTMSAGFYFALTPSCVMMGGNLSITYQKGRIKAWFHTWADFFMQWKPFAYDISVGVSMGASYRWDYFPFYKTFTVELGASLMLYGPPFGGKVHVSWYIVSFTISFGAGRPAPNPIDWGEFADTFLKSSDGKQNEAVQEFLAVRAVSGVLRQGKDAQTHLLNAECMRIEVTTQMPCTLVKLDQNVVIEYPDLGILPMDVKRFSSILSVEVRPKEKTNPQKVGLQAVAICSNLPRALWDEKKPNPDDIVSLKEKVPMGVALYCDPCQPEAVSNTYDMQVLCRNEHLTPHTYDWSHPGLIEPNVYPDQNRLGQIEDSIGKTGGLRHTMLSQLSEELGTFSEDELMLDNWKAKVDELLLAVPEFQKIGAGG